MNNYKGFTLIEVMVALACMVGALSVTLTFSMALYRSWKETAQSMQVRMSLQAAIDVMRRDLERAPREQASHENALHESASHESALHERVGLKSITHEHVSHESASHESASHKPALKSVTQWYVTGPHEIIWRDRNSSQALRICVVKGRLERCEGTYDERSRQWHTRSVSVLANNIKELRCLFHKGVTHAGATHDSATDWYSAVDVELLTLSGVQEHALIAIGVGVLS